MSGTDAFLFVVCGVIVFAALPVAYWRRLPGWVIGVAAVWTLLAAVPYLILVGVPDGAWLVATARCGHEPAIASNFAAGDWYDLPGDLTYGPSPFDSHYYCSAAEAERAGFHRGLGPARP